MCSRNPQNVLDRAVGGVSLNFITFAAALHSLEDFSLHSRFARTYLYELS
jgi:hypothetical protein